LADCADALKHFYVRAKPETDHSGA